MNRIPDKELQRLKRETDLAALIRASGVELKPLGKDLRGHCPFHNDRSPSLVVTTAKNLWHCLGACGTGGGPIDWVMKWRKVDFRQAVEILQTTPLVASPSPATPAIPTAPATSASPPSSSLAVLSDAPLVEDEALLQRVVSYYQAVLKKSPAAQQYLEKRGLSHPELLERFRIGFGDRTLSSRLPAESGQEKSDLRQRLTVLGIFRQSGHEHFNGSLVFPLFSLTGEIRGLYGRKTGGKLRTGTALHLYLPGPHRGLFNPSAFSSKTIILCESVIDALSFWVNGWENVTCAYGVNGFTPELREALISAQAETVYLAFDADEAGDRAALRIGAELSTLGIRSLRVRFPDGDDANSFMLRHAQGEARKTALANLLAKAVASPGCTEPQLRPVGSPGCTEPQLRSVIPANKGTLPVKTGTGNQIPEGSPRCTEPQLRPNGLPSTRERRGKTGLSSTGNVHNLDKNGRADMPGGSSGYMEEGENELLFTFGERRWRVRGLERNRSFEVLRVNLRLTFREKFHLDTLDLYQARLRQVFLNIAASETGLDPELLKQDLGKMLQRLEERLEQQIREGLKPGKKTVVISEEARQAALEYLRSPQLLERIAVDFEACGLAGEKTNCLVGYLASISRKLEKPLAVIIQSSSSAGKSTLMEAILSFMPPEDQVRFTAMTGQSLFYMGSDELVHKTLAISEEEGAEKAQYAIKTLQSEQRLRIASTGKDPKTGRLETQEYSVEGPTQLMLTTTSAEIDEELQNRCLILTVNESREQTGAIHARQRELETLEGLILQERKKSLLELHRNAQRLLKPLKVVNPHAARLRFPTHLLRLRRDHAKYLGLIRTIALLHQHGKEIRSVEIEGKSEEYIEVEPRDIELANGLMNEILAHSLDELAPQTRKLLRLITEMVEKTAKEKKCPPGEVRFTRRQIREYTGWGNTRLKIHLHRLEELEYLVLIHGGHRQRFVYELLFGADAKENKSFLLRLTTPKDE